MIDRVLHSLCYVKYWNEEGGQHLTARQVETAVIDRCTLRGIWLAGHNLLTLWREPILSPFNVTWDEQALSGQGFGQMTMEKRMEERSFVYQFPVEIFIEWHYLPLTILSCLIKTMSIHLTLMYIKFPWWYPITTPKNLSSLFQEC